MPTTSHPAIRWLAVADGRRPWPQLPRRLAGASSGAAAGSRLLAAPAGRHQGRASADASGSLWTYDAATGKYRRGRRRRVAALRAEPAQAGEAADLRLRRGLGGDPVLGLDQQGHLPDRRRARHRRSSTATRSSSRRRRSPAPSSSSQQKPDFAIVSNWQSGAAEADHEDLRRRQDPGRQHRRLASERHLLRRRQLRLGRDRRQGRRRIRQGARTSAAT